jgi:hypothetical protein
LTTLFGWENVVMNVLSDDVKLPSHLDRLTDIDLDLRRVRGMVRVGPNAMFVALSGRGHHCFFKLMLNGAMLEPIWPGDERGALVESEGAIWRVDLDGQKGRLLTVPEGAWRDLVEVPEGCRGLSISRDGQRMAWREALRFTCD